MHILIQNDILLRLHILILFIYVFKYFIALWKQNMKLI